jgi:hypothetical protein
MAEEKSRCWRVTASVQALNFGRGAAVRKHHGHT